MWGMSGLGRLQMSWWYQYWKQMLNWLEIILAESHSWRPGTKTNWCKMHFEASDPLDFEKSDLFSLWHCCRTSHRPHIGASCWKQWGAPLRSAGWYQDLLGALNGSSISVTPSLIALEGQSVTSFSSSCCRWNSCTNGDALLKWWVNWKILKKFFQGLQAGTSAK